MNTLSFSEIYTLLLLSSTGKRTDISNPQYSAGIVLGCIYDLLQSGCITMDINGFLKIQKSLPAEYTYLRDVYNGINQKNKKLSKWLEYYCCNPTSKNIRPLINSMYYTLSDKGYVNIEVKKGFLKTKTSIYLHSDKITPILENFQTAVLHGTDDEHIIFATQLLLLADVLKNIFSMGQRLKVNSAISDFSKSQIWKNTKPYINIIRNFNYQNSLNSGAMYSE